MYARKLIRGAAAVALLATPITVALPTDGWGQVNTIIVTTRRREENIQDIPIAVTAFGLQDIDRKSIDSISDLSLLSSSLQFDTSAAPDATRIVVRGLSPTRGRQNAAILIDGIDISSESIAQTGAGAFLQSRLVDLQRVEVAKGPQSALYGRSAFNGAIQFITREPSEEFEAEIQLEGGNFDRYEAEASVSGPLTDTLGFRVSANWWDEEGFFRNARTGQKVGNQEGFSVVGTVRWEATDDVWLRFRAEYVDQEQGPSASVRVPFNVVTATPAGACVDQGGFGSVFNCGPIGSLTAAQAALIDGALNPTGNAAVAGPVTATNGLIGGYAATVATQSLFGQFRGTIPQTSDLPGVQLSPDPRTGRDFRGLEEDHVRLSLQAGWDVGIGEIRSWTGFFDGTSDSVQDWQAAGDLANCGTFVGIAGPADSCVLSFNANIHELTQIQQELRFASDWDFWAQLTVGGNFWYEKRDFFDKGGTIRARSIECEIDATPAVTGPCGVFSVPITGAVFQDFLDSRETVFGGLLDGRTGQRKLEHWSAYMLSEIDLDDMFAGMFDGEFLGGGWSLVAEARYNRETETLTGLDSSGTGSTGANICGGGPIFGAVHPFSFFPGTPDADNACSGVPIFGLIQFSPFAPPLPGTSGGPPLLPVTAANFPTRLCDFTAAELANPAIVRDPATTIVNCDGDATSPVKTGSITSDWFTGKLTLQWQPTEDLLLYFSHGWSQKPEGFATGAFGSSGFEPNSARFESEKMRVYEAGFKSTWLENTLVINGAGFFQDFTDKQVSTQRVVPDPLFAGAFTTSPAVINASGAEVWGGEIDVLFSPDVDVLGGNISFAGSYTYLRAKYTDYTTVNFSGTDIHVVGNCTPFLDPLLLAPSCIVDRSGFTLEDAPEHAATLSASIVAPLGNICGCDVDWFFETDAQYTGGRFVEDAQAVFVSDWWNANLRLGVQTESYELLFFVNNVFQGDGVQSGFTLPGLNCCFNFAHLRSGVGALDAAVGGPIFNSGVAMANLRPPRHWGFRATARF